MTLLYALIFVFSLLQPESHPLHYSMVNVEQADNSGLSVVVKVFKEDIEKIIEEKYRATLNFGKDNERKDWHTYVQRYLESSLVFMVNDTKVSGYTDLSRQIEDDGLIIKFKVPVNKNINGLVIQNTLLLDLYYDQTNLLIVTCNGRDFTGRLDNQNTLLKMVFDK